MNAESMNLFTLNGRKAIVAGGAGDLGRAIVAALRDAGVHVAVLDIASDLEGFTAEASLPGAPGVYAVRADLTDRDDLARGFDHALSRLGSLDILVNAQGIQRRYPAEEFPVEVWDEVLAVNLTSVFALCQLAGRVMLKKGYGKIINIASMQSYNGGYAIAAYAASKAGVAQITKALSNEWAGRGVNVNAIAPGYMDTKMTAAVKADPVRYPQILARIPIGRWGTPRDLCGPLLFLAAPASDYVTGVIFPVDGGMLGT
jgi:2-deoxy-D-gluconate 3-dehydrogenase